MVFLKELEACKTAARILRSTTIETRRKVLENLSKWILSERESIIKANERDLNALPADATAAFRDRLLLDANRIKGAVESLRQVIALNDPLADEGEKRRLPNGLVLRGVRSPLGVIFIIFESRPNVALEAFSLALISGNVLILRGGKESMHTTGEIYRLMNRAVTDAGLQGKFFWGITDPDRGLVETLLHQDRYIDTVVPRGGDSLIHFVVENSRIPIIKNDRGLCHVYVDEDADLEMAKKIVVNAKTQRPGVCNAMETVLVHRSLKDTFLPALYSAMEAKNVHWYGCPSTLTVLKGKPLVSPAEEKCWDTEYLDLKMNCRVVDSLDQAIQHIEQHGSHHSESIVTRTESAARRFQKEIDAAAVYWNASTRFTDGFEFGLGGELGISTQKLHVRGPVGPKGLTSIRWVIDGTGQTRS